jgi:GTPase SAR1 family protein
LHNDINSVFPPATAATAADEPTRAVLVGSSGVGKTTMINQLVDHPFREEGQPMVGIDYKSIL